MMGMIVMPKYLLVAIIPIGFLTILIQFLRIFVGLLRGKHSTG